MFILKEELWFWIFLFKLELKKKCFDFVAILRIFVIYLIEFFNWESNKIVRGFYSLVESGFERLFSFWVYWFLKWELEVKLFGEKNIKDDIKMYFFVFDSG